MTELLYQTDSYLRSFDATVEEIDEENHAIVLDRSAFYPGGGGQPNDLGTLTISGASMPLQRARKIGERVIHILPAEVPLPPVGSAVHAQLDWERRYALMRTHTAMHILCGVIFRDYGAVCHRRRHGPAQRAHGFRIRDHAQGSGTRNRTGNQPGNCQLAPDTGRHPAA